MNICLIIRSHYPPYPHGGVGSFAVDLAEGVANQGHKITCISLYSSKTLKTEQPISEFINGVKVVRVPQPYENFPARIRKVLEKLYVSKLVRGLHKTQPFDIIECEDGLGMLGIGKLPPIPKVVRLHASTIYNDFVLKRKPSRMDHFFEKLWIGRSDHIIAVSDFVGRTTLSLVNLQAKKKLTIIHYAIDTEFYKPIPSIKTKKGLIVFTGVVAPRKGVLELIKAMNIVFSKDETAQLLIIGDDQYPHGQSSFKDGIIHQLDKKYRHRVQFAGPQPRKLLPSLVQAAELCCFPSHVETFGIGIIEAMAMEKPVIYMETGPGPEVVEDGVSGILCDTFDSMKIAEKIQYLLANPSIGKMMGKKARERVIRKFEKGDWINRNLDYYTDCINHYD